MTNKMGPWITGAVIHALGGRYVGRIAAVEERTLYNRFTKRTAPEVVIVFDDGRQLVPSQGMRVELSTRFGTETDHWIGEWIALGARPGPVRNGKPTWERFLLPAGDEGSVSDEASDDWGVQDGDDRDDREDLGDEQVPDDRADDLAFPVPQFGRRRG
jgi:hypothetical protein